MSSIDFPLLIGNAVQPPGSESLKFEDELSEDDNSLVAADSLETVGKNLEESMDCYSDMNNDSPVKVIFTDEEETSNNIESLPRFSHTTTEILAQKNVFHNGEVDSSVNLTPKNQGGLIDCITEVSKFEQGSHNGMSVNTSFDGSSDILAVVDFDGEVSLQEMNSDPIDDDGILENNDHTEMLENRSNVFTDLYKSSPSKRDVFYSEFEVKKELIPETEYREPLSNDSIQQGISIKQECVEKVNCERNIFASVSDNTTSPIKMECIPPLPRLQRSPFVSIEPLSLDSRSRTQGTSNNNMTDTDNNIVGKTSKFHRITSPKIKEEPSEPPTIDFFGDSTRRNIFEVFNSDQDVKPISGQVEIKESPTKSDLNINVGKKKSVIYSTLKELQEKYPSLYKEKMNPIENSTNDDNHGSASELSTFISNVSVKLEPLDLPSGITIAEETYENSGLEQIDSTVIADTNLGSMKPVNTLSNSLPSICCNLEQNESSEIAETSFKSNSSNSCGTGSLFTRSKTEDFVPDFDEIDDLMFISFATQDSLEAHVEIEKQTRQPRNKHKDLLDDVSRFKTKSSQSNKKQKKKKAKRGAGVNHGYRGINNKILLYERMLCEELSKRKHRQTIHPDLQKAGITRLSQCPAKRYNLAKLGVTLDAPISTPVVYSQETCRSKSTKTKAKSTSRKKSNKKPKSKEIQNVSSTPIESQSSKASCSLPVPSSESFLIKSEPTTSHISLTADPDKWRLPETESEPFKPFELPVTSKTSAFVSKELDEYLDQLQDISSVLTESKITAKPVSYFQPDKPQSYVRTLDMVLNRRKKNKQNAEQKSQCDSLVYPSAAECVENFKNKPQEKLDLKKKAKKPRKKKVATTKNTHEDSDDSLDRMQRELLEQVTCTSPIPSETGSVNFDYEEEDSYQQFSDGDDVDYKDDVDYNDDDDDVEISTENFERESLPSCGKDYCRLGCLCGSVEGNRTVSPAAVHCRKVDCMFGCMCDLALLKSDKKQPIYKFHGEYKQTKPIDRESTKKSNIISSLTRFETCSRTRTYISRPRKQHCSCINRGYHMHDHIKEKKLKEKTVPMVVYQIPQVNGSNQLVAVPAELRKEPKTASEKLARAKQLGKLSNTASPVVVSQDDTSGYMLAPVLSVPVQNMIPAQNPEENTKQVTPKKKKSKKSKKKTDELKPDSKSSPHKVKQFQFTNSLLAPIQNLNGNKFIQHVSSSSVITSTTRTPKPIIPSTSVVPKDTPPSTNVTSTQCSRNVATTITPSTSSLKTSLNTNNSVSLTPASVSVSNQKANTQPSTINSAANFTFIEAVASSIKNVHDKETGQNIFQKILVPINLVPKEVLPKNPVCIQLNSNQTSIATGSAALTRRIQTVTQASTSSALLAPKPTIVIRAPSDSTTKKQENSLIGAKSVKSEVQKPIIVIKDTPTVQTIKGKNYISPTVESGKSIKPESSLPLKLIKSGTKIEKKSLDDGSTNLENPVKPTSKISQNPVIIQDIPPVCKMTGKGKELPDVGNLNSVKSTNENCSSQKTTIVIEDTPPVSTMKGKDNELCDVKSTNSVKLDSSSSQKPTIIIKSTPSVSTGKDKKLCDVISTNSVKLTNQSSSSQKPTIIIKAISSVSTMKGKDEELCDVRSTKSVKCTNQSSLSLINGTHSVSTVNEKDKELCDVGSTDSDKSLSQKPTIIIKGTPPVSTLKRKDEELCDVGSTDSVKPTDKSLSQKPTIIIKGTPPVSTLKRKDEELCSVRSTNSAKPTNDTQKPAIIIERTIKEKDKESGNPTKSVRTTKGYSRTSQTIIDLTDDNKSPDNNHLNDTEYLTMKYGNGVVGAMPAPLPTETMTVKIKPKTSSASSDVVELPSVSKVQPTKLDKSSSSKSENKALICIDKVVKGRSRYDDRPWTTTSLMVVNKTAKDKPHLVLIDINSNENWQNGKSAIVNAILQSTLTETISTKAAGFTLFIFYSSKRRTVNLKPGNALSGKHNVKTITVWVFIPKVPIKLTKKKSPQKIPIDKKKILEDLSCTKDDDDCKIIDVIDNKSSKDTCLPRIINCTTPVEEIKDLVSDSENQIDSERSFLTTNTQQQDQSTVFTISTPGQLIDQNSSPERFTRRKRRKLENRNMNNDLLSNLNSEDQEGVNKSVDEITKDDKFDVDTNYIDELGKVGIDSKFQEQPKSTSEVQNDSKHKPVSGKIEIVETEDQQLMLIDNVTAGVGINGVNEGQLTDGIDKKKFKGIELVEKQGSCIPNNVGTQGMGKPLPMKMDIHSQPIVDKNHKDFVAEANIEDRIQADDDANVFDARDPEPDTSKSRMDCKTDQSAWKVKKVDDLKLVINLKNPCVQPKSACESKLENSELTNTVNKCDSLKEPDAKSITDCHVIEKLKKDENKDADDKQDCEIIEDATDPQAVKETKKTNECFPSNIELSYESEDLLAKSIRETYEQWHRIINRKVDKHSGTGDAIDNHANKSAPSEKCAGAVVDKVSHQKNTDLEMKENLIESKLTNDNFNSIDPHKNNDNMITGIESKTLLKEECEEIEILSDNKLTDLDFPCDYGNDQFVCDVTNETDKFAQLDCGELIDMEGNVNTDELKCEIPVIHSEPIEELNPVIDLEGNCIPFGINNSQENSDKEKLSNVSRSGRPLVKSWKLASQSEDEHLPIDKTKACRSVEKKKRKFDDKKPSDSKIDKSTGSELEMVYGEVPYIYNPPITQSTSKRKRKDLGVDRGTLDQQLQKLVADELLVKKKRSSDKKSKSKDNKSIVDVWRMTDEEFGVDVEPFNKQDTLDEELIDVEGLCDIQKPDIETEYDIVEERKKHKAKAAAKWKPPKKNIICDLSSKTLLPPSSSPADKRKKGATVVKGSFHDMSQFLGEPQFTESVVACVSDEDKQPGRLVHNIRERQRRQHQSSRFRALKDVLNTTVIGSKQTILSMAIDEIKKLRVEASELIRIKTRLTQKNKRLKKKLHSFVDISDTVEKDLSDAEVEIEDLL